MKRFTWMCSALILSSILLAPLAQAQETRPTQGTNSTRQTTRELSPFDLTSLAYQGYFAEQGIPGYGNLILELDTGRIDADDLIQAAVDAGRLSSETQDNNRYRSTLRQHLLSLRNSYY